MMRVLAGLLLIGTLVGAAPADDYFDVGVDYLKKGFYGRARAAFSESLVRAPGQPVPMAFLGIASAAEGRPPVEAAVLFRWTYERLPKDTTLRLDLRTILPSAKAVELLQDEVRGKLAKARKGADRRPLLGVLAFLEIHDGDPSSAPALDELNKELPGDRYVEALLALKPKPDADPAPAPAAESQAG